MRAKTAGNWWSRKLWVVVLFPTLAAALLVIVGVLKGGLHRWVGFDSDGKPLAETAALVTKLRTAITEEEASRHVVADLQRHDRDVRARFRYLTLVHRNNEPLCRDADLDAERRAIRELGAQLARGDSAKLDFIDPHQLLFRIDLEEFGWDAATDWHRVVAQYRYGLGGVGEDTLSRLRRQMTELTSEAIPVVRGDWFVVALTRAPLAGADGLMRVQPGDLPGSVQVLAARYPTQTLDLAACARELEVEDGKVIAGLIRREETLRKEFGLAPLLEGGRVRRDWWDSDRNFYSPYQEVARRLKLGKPVRVQ